MSDNSSNRVNIIIAILAIFLIFGGVFLLNQSFNGGFSPDPLDTSSGSSLTSNYTVNRGGEQDDSTTDIVPSGTFQPSAIDQDAEDIQDQTSSSVTENSSQNSSSTIPSEDDIQVENVQVSETATENESTEKLPQNTQPTSDAPKDDNKSEPESENTQLIVTPTLMNNQFTATVTSVNGLNYQLKLTDCGQKGLYCTSGTILNLYNLPAFTNDSIDVSGHYLFTGNYSEDANGIFVGSLSSIQRL